MKYQQTCACEACGRTAACLYTPTGPWRGVWRCLACDRKDDDAEGLADLAKVAGRAADPPAGVPGKESP